MDHLNFKNWRTPEPPKPTIKPCPACGEHTCREPLYRAAKKWCVICYGCGLRAPDGEDSNAAITAWNDMPRREDLAKCWVPVTERLPPDVRTYSVLRRQADGTLLRGLGYNRFGGDVTHWLDPGLVPRPENAQ